VIAPRTDAVAIVSGGSYGVGREVVRMLARCDYAIVVVYLDDQSSAEATVEEVLAAYGTAVAVRADVTDDLDVARLFDETIAAFGGVDAVIDTTAGSVSVLYQHAVRHLQGGSAIVGISTADHGIADLISFLDRRRHRPSR
jgi:NADP-dependent 3-hydroxy acid dehydrogenase YdfG